MLYFKLGTLFCLKSIFEIVLSFLFLLIVAFFYVLQKGLIFIIILCQAISVTERVSDERCESSPGGDGSLVGYQVRLESARCYLLLSFASYI